MNLTEEQMKRLAGIVAGDMRLEQRSAGDPDDDTILFQFQQNEQNPFLALNAKIWSADGYLFVDTDKFEINMGIGWDGRFFVTVNDKEVFKQEKTGPAKDSEQ